MKIFKNEEIKKENVLTKNYKVEPYLLLIVGIIAIGFGIYLIAISNVKEGLIVIAIGLISIIYQVCIFIKNKKTKNNPNSFLTIKDEISNKTIENKLLDMGIDNNLCDYFYDGNTIQIAYAYDENIYVLCCITKNTYRFGLEIMDEIYDNNDDDAFEKAFSEDESHLIDEFEEFRFKNDSDESIVYKGLLEFYNNHKVEALKLSKIINKKLK